MENNCRKKNGGKKNSQKLNKKWWPKKVLGTYLLVATELLFDLGVYRPKWPEMELNFFNRVQNFQSSGVSIRLLTKKRFF